MEERREGEVGKEVGRDEGRDDGRREGEREEGRDRKGGCLLYTSDAADE